jgi:DNA-binding NtrC family response regulator
MSATDIAGHMRKLEEIETEMIRMAISRYKGHMSEVARRLGIGRSTLYRKLKDLGLEQHMADEQGEPPMQATG